MRKKSEAEKQAERVIQSALAFIKSGAADAVHITFSLGAVNVGSFSSRLPNAEPELPVARDGAK